MQTPQKFTVGLIQMSVALDSEENLKRAISRIEEAASLGAKVICLPELFSLRYFCQCEDTTFFDLAEPIPGQTTEELGKVARKTKVVLIAPIFERRAPGIYHNSAAIIDADGEIVGLYRKMHIPDDPAYFEKFYFTPGDLGFQAFDTSVGRVGTLICWDQWYPEAARLVALKGVSILFYPTAIGWHPNEKEEFGQTQLDAWRTVQRGHAIANGVYVAAVNRIGHEIPSDGGPGIEFWGSSFLCDPQGIMLAEGGVDREEIILVQIDLGRIEDVRRNWPFLRDRRIDAYGEIDRRYLDK
jgi:N-carbamoylputrescine amidase